MSSASATIVGSVVTFPTPPLGLVASSYVLAPVENARSVYTLRSHEESEEEVRLFLVDPKPFFPEYLPAVRRAITRVTGEDLVNVAVFVVLNPGEHGDRPTANLLAPILVDAVEGIGVQTVLDGDDWPLRAPLTSAKK